MSVIILLASLMCIQSMNVVDVTSVDSVLAAKKQVNDSKELLFVIHQSVSIKFNESAMSKIDAQSPEGARISIDEIHEKSPMIQVQPSPNCTITDVALNAMSDYRRKKMVWGAIIIVVLSIGVFVYAYFALQDFEP